MKLHRTLLEVVAYGASVVAPVVLLLLFVVLPRTNRIDIPLHFSHDGVYTATWIKAVIDGESWWNVSRLAAPFGHNLYLHPVGATIDYGLAGLIGLLLGDVGLAVNVTWFSFVGLTGLSAYWVLRSFSVGCWSSLTGSTLYALAPFTLLRQISHLNLSIYLVPPMCLVACLLFLGTFGEMSRGKRLSLLLFVVLAGLNSPYNAFFALVVFCHAALFRVVLRKNWRYPIVVCVLLLCVMVINLIPGYLALRDSPAAADNLADRPIRDVNRVGFVLRELFIPVPDHPFPPFRKLAELNDTEFQPHQAEHRSERLGLFGAVGALVLLAVMVVPGGATSSNLWRELTERLSCPAKLALGLILLGSVGGFSNFVALVEGGTIRGYSRISVFVGFFAILASVMLLDGLLRSLSRNALKGVIASIVILLGVVDQKNVFFLLPNSRVAEYEDLSAFVGKVEDSLDSGGMVYIIPNQEVYDRKGYRNIRFYLLSESLKWSHAPVVMSSRATDWYHWLEHESVVGWPLFLLYAGFDGVMVCRQEATSPDQIVNLFSRYPDVEVIESESKNYQFINLKHLRKNLISRLGDVEYSRRAKAVLERPKIPEYMIGSSIEFGRFGNAILYRDPQWIENEDFAWTSPHRETNSSTLTLSLAHPEKALTINLEIVGAYITDSSPRQVLGLQVNGKPIGSWILNSDLPSQLSIPIEANVNRSGRPLELTFINPTAVSPRDSTGSGDTRRFGIKYASIVINEQ